MKKNYEIRTKNHIKIVNTIGKLKYAIDKMLSEGKKIESISENIYENDKRKHGETIKGRYISSNDITEKINKLGEVKM